MPVCQIQKIYTTPLHLCLSIRRPGETLWFWLGRQKPYLGAQVITAPPPAQYRIKDVAVEWLRSKFSGRWLQSFTINPLNGSLELIETAGDVVLVLGWHQGRLAYLEARQDEDGQWLCQRSDQTQVFKVEDWRQISFFEKVPDGGDIDLPQELEKWAQKQQSLQTKKIQHKKKRKSENIKADLEKLKNFEALYELARDHAQLMRGHELTHQGVRFKFKSNMTAHQRADMIFEKAKRFKKALDLQQKRLQEVQRSQPKDQVSVQRQEFNVPSLQWKFGASAASAKLTQEASAPGQVLTIDLPGGGKIAVGTSAQTNDYLRKSWAKKDDLWAHIENVTGAHLFYRGPSDPDLALWSIMASILRDHSNTKAEQVTLVWTKARYLKAVKGAAGMVRFTHEKRITLNYEPQWRNLLSAL